MDIVQMATAQLQRDKELHKEGLYYRGTVGHLRSLLNGERDAEFEAVLAEQEKQREMHLREEEFMTQHQGDNMSPSYELEPISEEHERMLDNPREYC